MTVLHRTPGSPILRDENDLPCYPPGCLFRVFPRGADRDLDPRARRFETYAKADTYAGQLDAAGYEPAMDVYHPAMHLNPPFAIADLAEAEMVCEIIGGLWKVNVLAIHETFGADPFGLVARRAQASDVDPEYAWAVDVAEAS